MAFVAGMSSIFFLMFPIPIFAKRTKTLSIGKGANARDADSQRMTNAIKWQSKRNCSRYSVVICVMSLLIMSDN